MILPWFQHNSCTGLLLTRCYTDVYQATRWLFVLHLKPPQTFWQLDCGQCVGKSNRSTEQRKLLTVLLRGFTLCSGRSFFPTNTIRRWICVADLILVSNYLFMIMSFRCMTTPDGSKRHNVALQHLLPNDYWGNPILRCSLVVTVRTFPYQMCPIILKIGSNGDSAILLFGPTHQCVVWCLISELLWLHTVQP